MEKEKNKYIYIDTDKIYFTISAIFIALYLFLICIPVISIIRFAGISNISNSIKNIESLQALYLSIKTSSITLILTFLLCTPTAFYLSKGKKTNANKLIGILLETPMVLPPAVAGIGLLLAFGNKGIPGSLFSHLNIEIVFTPIAVVLAQFFVASVFYVQLMRTALDSVPKEIFDVSYVMGASKFQTAFYIILPLVKKSIISGLMLTWIRAMGEFGATIMFAGNIISKTRTTALLVYTFMQTDFTTAVAFSGFIYFISFSLLLLIKLFFIKEECY
ncbi:MAG: ABC transporter permease subunit [Clostridiaceae bacterium]|nr:ABC transporter permease subunit [Clostridiaceae bacterium]